MLVASLFVKITVLRHHSVIINNCSDVDSTSAQSAATAFSHHAFSQPTIWVLRHGSD